MTKQVKKGGRDKATTHKTYKKSMWKLKEQERTNRDFIQHPCDS